MLLTSCDSLPFLLTDFVGHAVMSIKSSKKFCFNKRQLSNSVSLSCCSNDLHKKDYNHKAFIL